MRCRRNNGPGRARRQKERTGIAMGTIEKLQKNGISFDYNDVVRTCEKYRVNELSIFGSSIREDFTPNSDVDILVSFGNDSEITLFDVMEMEREFSKFMKWPVGVVEKESLKNPVRKNRILSTREVVYATQ